MATTLSEITASFALGARTSDTIEGQSVTHRAILSAALSLSHGTSENQVNRWKIDVDRSLQDTGNDDLDLFDLTGFQTSVDIIGNTVTFAEIVAVFVLNQSGSAGTMTVGNNATTAAWQAPFNASDTGAIGPFGAGGGCLMFYGGADPAWDVTDTSNHLLRVSAAGGNITYDIGVLGRSA